MGDRKDENLRRDERHALSIDGKCRFGLGLIQPAIITDLSSRGCGLEEIVLNQPKVRTVTVWIGPVGPLKGELRWSADGAVGVEFNQPVAGVLLDYLRIAHPKMDGLLIQEDGERAESPVQRNRTC